MTKTLSDFITELQALEAAGFGNRPVWVDADGCTMVPAVIIGDDGEPTIEDGGVVISF